MANQCGWAHWFAYYGQVGTSSPVCVRFGCNARNPRYDRDRDPYAGYTSDGLPIREER